MSLNDDFKIIYKILSLLEKGLDIEEFSSDNIYNCLKDEVTKSKFDKILIMLYESGYIKGTKVNNLYIESITNYQITLKGLEYLLENSIMKRIYNSIKGISDIIP